MQTATCLVQLNKFGSKVVREHVTPAEAQYLIVQFTPHCGGANPVTIMAINKTQRGLIENPEFGKETDRSHFHAATKEITVNTDQALSTAEDGQGNHLLVPSASDPCGYRIRTSAEEKARLKRRFDGNPKVQENKVEQLYSGINPKLPEKFEEVSYTDGSPAFMADGTTLDIEPEKVTIEGKTYTIEQLKAFVPKQSTGSAITPSVPAGSTLTVAPPPAPVAGLVLQATK